MSENLRIVLDRAVWEKRAKTREESILKRRTLHRRRMRAVRPVIARDFSDLDFRSSLLYRIFLLPLASYPLCRLSKDPSSRDPASPPHYVIFQFLHPYPSRIGFVLRLARWCANRGATSRYFCRFYFGEHLVVGMWTKETCSLRKSQEARGWPRARG